MSSDPNDSTTPEIVQHAETEVIAASNCEKLFGANFNNDMQVCINDEAKAVCSGDSGGPVILKVS